MTITLESRMAGHGSGHDSHDKKKYIHLDDFFADLTEKHSKKIEESLKKYEEFTEEENLNNLYNNVFTPAHDEFYKTVTEHLKTIGEDETKTEDKKEELQKAIVEGLKAYFEKVQPSIVKALEEHQIGDVEDQYHFLTTQYDEHIGADFRKGEGLTAIAEQFAKSKKLTLGHLKRRLWENQTKHAQKALDTIVNKYAAHHFTQYHPVDLAKYLKPHIEKAGLEVEDKLKFIQLSYGDLIHIISALKTGKWGEHGYGQYGFKQMKPEAEGSIPHVSQGSDHYKRRKAA